MTRHDLGRSGNKHNYHTHIGKICRIYLHFLLLPLRICTLKLFSSPHLIFFLMNIPYCDFYARALLPIVIFSWLPALVTNRSKSFPSLFTVHPGLWLLQRSWRSWRACGSLAAWRDGRSQQERDSGKYLYCPQPVERRRWWALWRRKMGIRQKVRQS